MMPASRGQPAFPFLECAILDGASLDGLVVGAIQIHLEETTPVIISRPRLQSVRFERKPTLANARIFVEAQIPEDWPQTHLLDDSVRASVRRFGDGKVVATDDIIRSEKFHWGHSAVLHALGGDATHSDREQTVNILTVGRVVPNPQNTEATETIGAVRAILAQKFFADIGMALGTPMDSSTTGYRNLGKDPVDCDARRSPDVRRLQERSIRFVR